MLKPPLARGELHVIGATTLDEYRKHVEKDPALERRFQPVLVGEPSVADTIAILRGLKEKYEVHHGVRITDNALVAAATLSDRYIGDRFLPDKAIDLVDEAASRLRIEIDSLPQEIDEVERRIVQLQIERQALLKEKDKAAVERRKTLEAEIAELRERADAMKAQWQAEKGAIGEIQQIRAEIDTLRAEMEQATRRGDLQRAAELQYGRIPELERQLQAGREAAAGDPDRKARYLKEEVDAEDIAEIVSQVDRHSGEQDARERARAAAQARGRAGRARRRAAPGRHRRGQRRAAEPRRPGRPQPADRLVHLPGPHRRRQDRDGARARRVPVRRRAGDGPDRHVGVHGEALGRAAHRRAAGLRRATRRAASSPRRCAAGRTA